MGRRGRNEGSIYQRKDGLWVGQYKVHTVNGGKYKYIYGRVREDVAKKLAKAMADRDSGFVFDSQSLTFEKYLDKWLNAIRGTVAYGTWKQYETVVRLHIKPALGSTKLDRLNPLHIQTLYRDKLDSSLSATAAVIIIEPSMVDAIPERPMSVPGTMIASMMTPGSRFLVLAVGGWCTCTSLSIRHSSKR